MALLVFFPAAAGARIVAAHLRLVAADRLLHRVVAAVARRLLDARRPRRRHRVRRRRSRRAEHRRGRGLGGGIVEDERRATLRRTAHDGRGGLFAQDRPQPPEVADDLLVDAILHRLEQLEAFLLVLDEWVALAVPAQADAFLQMIEAVEVILPLL